MPYIANPLEGIPLVNTFITDQDELGATPATDDKLIIFDESATALKQLTIAELQASVLVSPAFTGTPTAPTQSAGNDTTRLATTAFVTAATTALNTVTEMTDVTITSIQADEVLKWNGSAWINQTLAQANILPAAGPTFTGVLTVGSAVISEADLELIDDLTVGTVVVSKAVTVDSNKDVGTIRNLTIDGIFTDGNYTFATDGSVTGLGTVASGTHTIGSLVVAAASITDTSGAISFGNENLTTTGTLAAGTTTIGTLTVAAASITDSSGALSFGNENLTTTGTLATAAITSSGIVKTDDATEATSTTDGSLQTDGGLSVVKDAVFGDDVKLLSDSAVLSFGADGDTTLTHTDGTGIGLNGTNKITFNDASQFIQGASNAILALGATDEIDLTATTIDINGAVALNGAITGATDITLSGELDAATGDFSGAVDIAGALTLSGADMDASDQNIAAIKTATFTLVNGGSASSGTIALNWANGMKQYVTLSGNVTITMAAPAGPCNVMLKIVHVGAGRTVTWNDSVTPIMWADGTAPTLAGAAGTDIVAFFYDGTNFYGSASVLFS